MYGQAYTDNKHTPPAQHTRTRILPPLCSMRAQEHQVFFFTSLFFGRYSFLYYFFPSTHTHSWCANSKPSKNKNPAPHLSVGHAARAGRRGGAGAGAADGGGVMKHDGLLLHDRPTGIRYFSLSHSLSLSRSLSLYMCVCVSTQLLFHDRPNGIRYIYREREREIS